MTDEEWEVKRSKVSLKSAQMTNEKRAARNFGKRKINAQRTVDEIEARDTFLATSPKERRNEVWCVKCVAPKPKSEMTVIQGYKLGMLCGHTVL